MGKNIITINRECGSGGRDIAHRMGEQLGLKIYDKAILEAICERYNLDKDEILRIKSQKLNFWDDLCRFYRQFGTVGDSYLPEDKKITSRELFYAEAQIMRNLAGQESCIVVGRTGFHIFKDDPDALHIFLIADRDIRIKKVAEREGLDEKAAAKYVDETDEARETFTKSFAGVSRYDARNYDLVINVSRFSSDEVATFLAENIRKKMGNQANSHYGDDAVAFYTPTISTGGGPGGGGPGGGGNSSATFISAPTTPSLATGNNVSGGTSYFEGNCVVANNGGTTGIEAIENGEWRIENDPRVFTIDGRYLGTEVPATFRGIYLQNGQKHLKLQ